jgi:hypothetical protein
MTSQIPKLHQAHTADIDDVIRRDNWGFGVGSRQCRAQWVYELKQVLVERKETEKTRWNGRVLVCFGRAVFAHFLREVGHVLVRQVAHFEKIDGDTAAVSTAGPLRVLPMSLDQYTKRKKSRNLPSVVSAHKTPAGYFRTNPRSYSPCANPPFP